MQREHHIGEPLPKLNLGRTALLLDVDGTLLDIAPRPEEVVVPQSLLASLRCLHDRTGGALALVSGRQVGDLDSLFAPLQLPAIGGHGGEVRRDPDAPMRLHPQSTLSDALKRRIAEIAEIDPRTIVEDKGSSFAVHYRLAPETEHILKDQIAALVGKSSESDLEILFNKDVIEIKPSGFNKGIAVRELMQASPFQGRLPLFVGDDKTDESVFEILPDLGGSGYSVGRDMPGASGIFSSPQEVRHWLDLLCEGSGRE